MTADRRCPRSLDEVDLFDPATQQDWCPTYDLLRAEAPVWRVPGTSTFVLTRDDDIAHVLRRTDLFGRGGAADAPARSIPDRVAAVYRERGWPRMTWRATEPPVHRKYRDLVDHFFSVAGAERRRPLITAIVHDLLDAMVPLGRADFLTVFATPLPVRVITGMMGFDDAEIPQLKAWSEAWVLPVRGNLTEDEEVYAGEQGVAFQQHIFATMEAKRARPDDSVISHLVNDARFDGERPLRDEEVISIVDHLYIGGNETTAAGNRDPVAFPDPTTIDVDRVNAHRHVAFSLGETHCPGAGLSRLEQTIAFEVSAGPTGRWPLVSDAGVGSSRGGGRRANSTWSDAPSTAGRCRRDRNPMSATSANPPTHMTNATCRRVGQMTASRTARSTTTTARRLATMRGRGTGNAANTLPDNSTAASTPATAARRCRPPARSTSAHPTNRSPPGGAPDSSAPSEGRTAPSTTSMAAATTPRPSQHAAADAIRHGNRDRSQPIASRENPRAAMTGGRSSDDRPWTRSPRARRQRRDKLGHELVVATSREGEEVMTYAVIQDVVADVAIQPGAVVSKVIHRDETVNVTVFGFDAHQELTEHRAARAAVVQVITGRLRFTVDGDELDARPGFWLHMAADTPHALVATEPTIMVLTLLRP